MLTLNIFWIKTGYSLIDFDSDTIIVIYKIAKLWNYLVKNCKKNPLFFFSPKNRFLWIKKKCNMQYWQNY